MTRKTVSAECAHCGALGPAGANVSAAVTLAAETGWLTGTRPDNRADYCRNCRKYAPKPCAVSHATGDGIATLMLSSVRDGLGSLPQYACGRHHQKVMAELFAGGAERVITEKTGASIRPRSR